MVVNKRTKQILSTDFSQGKTHDFQLFKDANLRYLKNHKILADSGYLGINHIFPKAEIPKKNTKKRKLNREEKRQNRELSSERILVENVIGAVKKFRILSEKYRNRRKRFNLRSNLISAIYNFEL